MPWPEFQRLKRDLRLRKLAAYKYMASRSENYLNDMKYKYRSMEVRTTFPYRNADLSIFQHSGTNSTV